MIVARGLGQGGYGSIVSGGFGIRVLEIVVPHEGDRAYGWIEHTRVSTVTVCDPEDISYLIHPDHDIVISSDPIPVGIDSSIEITNPRGEVETERIVHVCISTGLYDDDIDYDAECIYDFIPHNISIKSITGRGSSITAEDVEAVAEVLKLPSTIESIMSRVSGEVDSDTVTVSNVKQDEKTTIKHRAGTIDIQSIEDP